MTENKRTCDALKLATPIIAIAMTISKGRSTAKKKYESREHHPEDRHLLLSSAAWDQYMDALRQTCTCVLASR